MPPLTDDCESCFSTGRVDGERCYDCGGTGSVRIYSQKEIDDIRDRMVRGMTNDVIN